MVGVRVTGRAEVLRAAAVAYLSFVVVFTLTNTAAAIGSRPFEQGAVSARLGNAVSVGLGFGLVLLAGILTVHWPVFKRLSESRALGNRAAASLLGAMLAVVPFVAFVWLFRDGESWGDLLRFWSRMPSELTRGVLPYAFSGAVFGAVMGPAEGGERGRRTSACS